MSVINKMLQELDRRNAPPGSQSEQPPQQVKVVAPRTGHEWFWRVVAGLMLVAVGWVGWVAVQLQLRPTLATEEAFRAAEQARRGSITTVPRSAPAVASGAPAAAPAASPGLLPSPSATSASSRPVAPPEAPKPAVREATETFKLAQAIETPVAERSAPDEPVKPASTKPEPAHSQPAPATSPAPAATPQAASSPAVSPPAASGSPPPRAGKPVVDKRNRARSGFENAEAQFRRAAAYLNQGRVSEAEGQLIGALHADPSHVAARQAYVALLLEQKRSDAAKRVLREGLEREPSQPVFSLALARILAEQRDYTGALEVMDRAGGVARNADFQAVRGAVMQRLGRHQEAVDAYLAAIQGGVQPATTWVGLGISLEALGRKAEAAQAYRRSLGGVLAPEVREYADSRVRALQ